MKTVTFIETETSDEIRINPDHVMSLKSNERDDGESTLLELSTGKRIAVDGPLAEVEARLKSAD